jgi:hypothetical protein
MVQLSKLRECVIQKGKTMAQYFPVSKYQVAVLEALGLRTQTTGAWAEEQFQKLGLSVRPVRVGRRSEPRIRLMDRRTGAAWNGDGDADDIDCNYEQLTAEQYEAIKQWIEE